MAETATLSLRVAQRFPGGFAIDAALDLALRPGAMLVLFGPSAAGKTTILRQIAGLERPDAGSVRFDNEIWCDTARHIWMPPQRRRVGLVFQEPTLFPHLTVGDNIRYGVGPSTPTYDSDPRLRPSTPTSDSDLRLRPSTPTPVTVPEIATMLGLGDLDNRYPRALSGGEAQRVALARALAPAPRLLLLDEPLASLDAPARLRLRRELRALLQTTGTPAILVTHDRSEAMAMGDIVAVVIGGQVRQVGPADEVFSRPADAEIAAALGIDAVLPGRVAGSSDGLIEVSIGEVSLRVFQRAPVAAGTAVYACVRAEEVALDTHAPADTSRRNHLAARIVSIAPEGAVERVALDCGFPLDALITRRSRAELKLTPGATVTATIDPASIHLVARS